MISRFRWIDRIRFSCIAPLLSRMTSSLAPRWLGCFLVHAHFQRICPVISAPSSVSSLFLLFFFFFFFFFIYRFDYYFERVLIEFLEFYFIEQAFPKWILFEFWWKKEFESRKFYSWINFKFWSCSVGRRKTYSSCSKTGEYLLPPLSGSKIIMNAWWTGINFYEGLSTRERPLLCL